MHAVLPQGTTQAPHNLANSHAAINDATTSQSSSSAKNTTQTAYGDVNTKLSFLSPDAPRAKGELFFWINKAPEGQPQSTVTSTESEVTVRDLRNLTDAQRREQGFTTDHAGFEIIEGFGEESTRQLWAEEKWNSEEWIKSEYYKDVDALLKKRFGATTHR